MERILAVSGVVSDQAQVQAVVARHDQGGVDGDLDARAVGAAPGQREAADDFVVDQHRHAAEIRQQGGRIGEIQDQHTGLEDFVFATAERDADLALDAAQAHALANLQVPETGSNLPFTWAKAGDGRDGAHPRLDLGRALQGGIGRSSGARLDGFNAAQTGRLGRCARDRRDRQDQSQARDAETS